MGDGRIENYVLFWRNNLFIRPLDKFHDLIRIPRAIRLRAREKRRKNTKTIVTNTASAKLHVIFHHAAIPVTTEKISDEIDRFILDRT